MKNEKLRKVAIAVIKPNGEGADWTGIEIPVGSNLDTITKRAREEVEKVERFKGRELVVADFSSDKHGSIPFKRD